MKRKAKTPYRSGMEARIVPGMLSRGALYEPLRLVYAAKPKFYIPDLVLPNGIAIEIKGWFTAADRAKMLLVKQQHSGLDLRLVLASPNQRLTKVSKNTQSGWCAQHDFIWAHSCVPEGWIQEPTNHKSLAVLNRAPRRKVTVYYAVSSPE